MEIGSAVLTWKPGEKLKSALFLGKDGDNWRTSKGVFPYVLDFMIVGDLVAKKNKKPFFDGIEVAHVSRFIEKENGEIHALLKETLTWFPIDELVPVQLEENISLYEDREI